MKLICDENLPKDIINRIKELGYNLVSIKDKYEGVSDKEIVNIARDENAVIMTLDKDYLNMLKFIPNMPPIIFLRILSFDTKIFVRIADLIHDNNLVSATKRCSYIEYKNDQLTIDRW